MCFMALENPCRYLQVLAIASVKTKNVIESSEKMLYSLSEAFKLPTKFK